jgi:hypothetical protein
MKTNELYIALKQGDLKPEEPGQDAGALPFLLLFSPAEQN